MGIFLSVRVCVVMMIPLKMISDCCDVTSGSLRGGEVLVL